MTEFKVLGGHPNVLPTGTLSVERQLRAPGQR